MQGFGAGSVLMANEPGCGSGRQKTYGSYGSGGSPILSRTLATGKVLNVLSVFSMDHG
jgi:hypothetical protein